MDYKGKKEHRGSKEHNEVEKDCDVPTTNKAKEAVQDKINILIIDCHYPIMQQFRKITITNDITGL